MPYYTTNDDVIGVTWYDDVTAHLLAVLLTTWLSLSDVTLTRISRLMTSANDGASCIKSTVFLVLLVFTHSQRNTALRPSVCLSGTRWYRVKTAKRIVKDQPTKPHIDCVSWYRPAYSTAQWANIYTELYENHEFTIIANKIWACSCSRIHRA